MRKLLIFTLIGTLCLIGAECRAQKFSLSTNMLELASLGTLNMEGSFSLSRRVSIIGGVRYNPFTFRKDDPRKQFQMRQRSYSLGLRIWPWHAWSGWWFAGKGRYQEYNFGGLLSSETSEGDRTGLGVYAGYTHMLGPHFNIEFGLGVWGGLDWFRKYSCQVCGITVEEGRELFVLPDDVMISLVYVF